MLESAHEHIPEISKSNKVHAYELPQGKIIKARVVNPEGKPDERTFDIVTRPHRGLSAAHIEDAMERIKGHPFFTQLFDSVPLDEYFVHMIFWGRGFSDDADRYLSPGWFIYALESKDANSGDFKFMEWSVMKTFFADTGMSSNGIYNARPPILYSGIGDMSKIQAAVRLSEIARNGEGENAIIYCEPLYDALTGKLLLFKF